MHGLGLSGQSIQITGGTSTISTGDKILFSGLTSQAPALQYSQGGRFLGLEQPQATSQALSEMPLVDYQTFGSSASITFPDPHGTAFTITVPLQGGTTFSYSGNVEGVPLGSVLATDQAEQYANAYAGYLNWYEARGC